MRPNLRFIVAAAALALSPFIASAGVTTPELNLCEPIIKLNEAKRFDESWAALKPLVKANNGRAMYVAAEMFREGNGVPAPDYELAMRYFKQAADNGFYPASEELAEMYRDGQGAPQDLVRAMSLFHEAAICENVPAIVNIGAMHGNGQGTPKDNVEAYAWYLNAPKNQAAQSNMKRIEAEATPDQIERAKRRAEQIKMEIARGRAAWVAKWGDKANGNNGNANGGGGNSGANNGGASSGDRTGDRTGGLAVTFNRDAGGKFTVKTVGGKLAETDMVEAGDTLLEINDKPVTGLTQAEVERLLSGPVDSNIQLRFDHKGTNTQIAMPREKVQ